MLEYNCFYTPAGAAENIINQKKGKFMREFMTKVSDYLDERKNDPDRREDRLAAVVIGAVAMVVIVLLLLILWGHNAREKERLAELDRLKEEQDSEQQLVSASFEEKAAEYMAQDSSQELKQEYLTSIEELKQEYLTSIEQLGDKIEELYETMTKIEQNLEETIVQCKEEDAALQKQITVLHTEVSNIVKNLSEVQTKLYDLTDIVQVMDQKTLPMIQQQLLELRKDVERSTGDIAKLYTKIAALEQEDAKLWTYIGNLEKTLKAAVNQNITEVNNHLDELLNQLTAVENRIGKLAVQTLRYHYDAEKNTLYLEPYQE